MAGHKEVHEPIESIYRYMRCPKCVKSLVHAEHKNYGKSIRDVQNLDFGTVGDASGSIWTTNNPQ